MGTLNSLKKTIPQFDKKLQEAKKLTFKQINRIISDSFKQGNTKNQKKHADFMQDVKKIKEVLEGRTEENNSNKKIINNLKPIINKEDKEFEDIKKNVIKKYNSFNLEDDGKENFFDKILFGGKYDKYTLESYILDGKFKDLYKKVKYGKYKSSTFAFLLESLFVNDFKKPYFDDDKVVDVLRCIDIVFNKDIVYINEEDYYHFLQRIENKAIKEKIINIIITTLTNKIKKGDEKFVYRNMLDKLLKYKYSKF